MFADLLRTFRPQQWVKNAFVLAPLVFSERLVEAGALRSALVAFALFCCASSAIYVVNDIRDREEDRRHPLKRNRPLARGTLSTGAAAAAAGVLVAVAIAGGALVSQRFLVVVAAYLVLQFAYSWKLKRVVILDVMSISLGFVLRVLGGAEAVHVHVSNWLLLCTTLVALFLAFSKRRHELILLSEKAAEQRGVLDHYSPAFLDQMINVVTASSVLAYSLYAMADETVEHFGSDHLVYTVPLVLYGIFRYLYLMYQRPTQRNPTEAILRDGPFVVNIVLWGLAVVWIVYLGG